jgi:hypothetical protein
MGKVAAILLLLVIQGWFLSIIARDCSKSPSERDKDYDNFL